MLLLRYLFAKSDEACLSLCRFRSSLLAILGCETGL